jgi:hypothetical protein
VEQANPAPQKATKQEKAIRRMPIMTAAYFKEGAVPTL